jgi:hypothetical protein
LKHFSDFFAPIGLTYLWPDRCRPEGAWRFDTRSSDTPWRRLGRRRRPCRVPVTGRRGDFPQGGQPFSQDGQPRCGRLRRRAP